MKFNAFKAYDIRGKVPEDLNTDMAYKIGRAFVAELQAQNIVVGRDVRLESEELAQALIRGLTDAGARIINLGLCGTEEVYFNTSYHNTDGGIMVTASHNPKGYNGFKLVAKGSQPISKDSGLKAIEQRLATNNLGCLSQEAGAITTLNDKSAYIDHLMSYIDIANLKPLKLVMDVGNGAAGAVIQQITARLPFECIYINGTPNGNFPNGVPNPLLPNNRATTANAVRQYQADFGIAWDGDFDRCFLFDENGEFIEGYYLVGLLAEMLLAKQPGAKIIYDTRLTWNTIDQVKQAGGIPIQSKTGHSFIKERMRLEDAIYGGEMSAHHYFKDFAYCDSGMIPWLLIAELISLNEKTLSSLVKKRQAAYPCSGELNYEVKEVDSLLEKVFNHYKHLNPKLDRTDGISLEFDNWRMNIRSSNTEPFLRLNIETKANHALVWEKVKEVETLLMN